MVQGAFELDKGKPTERPLPTAAVGGALDPGTDRVAQLGTCRPALHIRGVTPADHDHGLGRVCREAPSSGQALPAALVWRSALAYETATRSGEDIRLVGLGRAGDRCCCRLAWRLNALSTSTRGIRRGTRHCGGRWFRSRRSLWSRLPRLIPRSSDAAQPPIPGMAANDSTARLRTSARGQRHGVPRRVPGGHRAPRLRRPGRLRR